MEVDDEMTPAVRVTYKSIYSQYRLVCVYWNHIWLAWHIIVLNLYTMHCV